MTPPPRGGDDLCRFHVPAHPHTVAATGSASHRTMEVLYEDNHIIIVNKAPGEIVQGDKTGDATLADAVKAYIKQKYAKPGQVFLGVAHRLDRPVSGAVVFARTSKALARLNDMFREGCVQKTYHASPIGSPATSGRTKPTPINAKWQGPRRPCSTTPS